LYRGILLGKVGCPKLTSADVPKMFYPVPRVDRWDPLIAAAVVGVIAAAVLAVMLIV